MARFEESEDREVRRGERVGGGWEEEGEEGGRRGTEGREGRSLEEWAGQAEERKDFPT